MNSISLPPTVIPDSHFIPDPALAFEDAGVEDEVSGTGQFIAEIASLSTQRIMEMTRSDLVEVIRKVRLRHLRPGVLEQLSRMDGTTLRRLVFATRRYCRGQALLLEGVLPNVWRCPR